MAIVKEGIAPNGARYIIRDDAYINCTPEEIRRRHQRANNAAYNILVDVARKRMEEEKQALAGRTVNPSVTASP